MKLLMSDYEVTLVNDNMQVSSARNLDQREREEGRRKEIRKGRVGLRPRAWPLASGRPRAAQPAHAVQQSIEVALALEPGPK